MRSKIATLLVGILLGALLFGGVAIAADLVVLPATATVYVDGVEKEVEAFNIDGYNYFKLRDFTAAVDIGVWWDGENNSIYIEKDKTYDADYTGPVDAPAEGEPAEGAPVEGEPAAGDPVESAPVEGEPADVEAAEGGEATPTGDAATA